MYVLSPRPTDLETMPDAWMQTLPSGLGEPEQSRSEALGCGQEKGTQEPGGKKGTRVR